jgi:hypothetical protein
VYVEGFERLRTQLEDFFSSLDDGGMVLLPILLELLKLGQAGELRHTIEKDFSDQMVQFVLDTDTKQTCGFEIHRHTLAIQSLNAYHRRACHFAA